MIRLQSVIIGIPIYKAIPTVYELFSFERSCKILYDYPFSIITHKELNVHSYINILNKYCINYEINYFEKKYFQSTNQYNQLMVSSFFYETFSRYQYILIYQLDAFVFSDQIIEWCNKGYDYVGAPWLNVNWVNKKQINKRLPFFTRSSNLFVILKNKDGLVGNGGLSLRKIQSFIKYSSIYSASFPSLEFNEDVFWGKYVAAKERSFKIPLYKEALLFSIENDPQNSLALIKNKIPFGCHAWHKNEILAPSWKTIFKIAGIELPEI